MKWRVEQLDNGMWDIYDDARPVFRDRDDLIEVEDQLRALGADHYTLVLIDGTEGNFLLG